MPFRAATSPDHKRHIWPQSIITMCRNATHGLASNASWQHHCWLMEMTRTENYAKLGEQLKRVRAGCALPRFMTRSASFNIRRHYKISNNYRTDRSQPSWPPCIHICFAISAHMSLFDTLSPRNEMTAPRRRILADFPLYNAINPIERSGSLIERSWTSAHSAVDTQ